MKLMLQTVVILLAMLCSFTVQGAPFTVTETANGTPYGLLGTGKNKPLALIFTTSIEESLTDKFTSLGSDLQKAGFLVASLDVPCHGHNVNPNEAAGLGCWRTRIEKGDRALFESFSAKVSDVVADLVAKGHVDARSVVAIGVSRGGYVALQAAARDPNIRYVVALSPVTNLQALTEFSGLRVNQNVFGFSKHYAKLAQKHIFLQIGNDDDRVGTADAIQLTQGVVASGKGNTVDFSTYIMPFKGHGTSKDQLAVEWILGQIGSTRRTSQGAAP